MDKTSYEEKALKLLKDDKTYNILHKNPVPKMQKELNKEISKLERETKLQPTLAKQLRNYTGNVPLFFSRPKIHKPDIPLRPIIDYTGSPMFQLSKFLAQFLTPIRNSSERSIKSGSQLIPILQNLQVPIGHCLASLDVISLFTSIPTDLAIEIISEIFDNTNVLDTLNSNHGTKLQKEDFLKLLQMCLNSTVIQYQNIYYKQIHGTAMGSPISSTIADIVMEYIETKILQQHSSHISLWKRYVDDILLIASQSQLSYILQTSNNISQHIQFTMEDEKDHKLPYLDILIERNLQKLTTSVYRKSTSTGKYLNFYSNHPISHKKSVIHFLINRMNIYCQNQEMKEKEKEIIFKDLKNNSYPENFIKHTIRSLNSKTGNVKQKSFQKYVSIPYIKGISEDISNLFRQYNILTHFKPINTIKSQLTSIKDKIQPEEKKNVVYAIPCNNCRSTYIGETKRTFKTRKLEHLNNLKKELPTSKLVNHMFENDHSPNWNNSKILFSSISNTQTRRFLETIASRECNHPMNDFIPMPAVYNTLRDII